MGLVRDVKINGQVTFTVFDGNYGSAHTIVGSALVIGDKRVIHVSLCETHGTAFWKDEKPIGAAISANYNDTLYPIEVRN